MQQPTTPAPTAPTEWATATTVTLVVIALLAIITLLAILRGSRLRGERKHARRAEEERIESEAPVVVPTPAPGDPRSATDAVAPPVRPVPVLLPVAPSPPPLDDAPVVGAPAAAPSLADEPIAAAAPLDASPASEAAAPATAEPSPAERPITLIKGLGPRVAARLEEQGVRTVGDLAALSDDAAEALDARLGPFTGRMGRDRWLEQARFLAAGDDKGFEAVFGRL